MESSFLYKARPIEIDGKFGLIFEDSPAPGTKPNEITRSEGMSMTIKSRIEALKDLEDGKISEEEYHIWIANFPVSLLGYNKEDYSDENILKTLGIE